ncbi:MAG: CidA/LrgA family protein, partial [Lachnospiraceae bacterium]|nr:CidA/LrgA family protein [Lachnospiraceae bacterium]
QQLAPIGVPVAVITLISTVVVMVISGKITQFVIHKEAQRKTAKKEV